MEQFEWAAKNIDSIDRYSCYEWADKNFSLDRISLMYEEYFSTLLKVHDTSGGFYAKNEGRENLDWMVKYYPKSIALTSPLDLLGEFCSPDAFVPRPRQQSGMEDVD